MKTAAKKPTKKKPVVKKGLFMRQSSKGQISVHIHASNGNKLTAMTGYNAPANMQKGLVALHKALIEALADGCGKYLVVDERKKVVKKK